MQNFPKEILNSLDPPPEDGIKISVEGEKWTTIKSNHRKKNRHPLGQRGKQPQRDIKTKRFNLQSSNFLELNHDPQALTENSGVPVNAAIGKSSNSLFPKPSGLDILKPIPSINSQLGHHDSQPSSKSHLGPSISSKSDPLGPTILPPSNKKRPNPLRQSYPIDKAEATQTHSTPSHTTDKSELESTSTSSLSSQTIELPYEKLFLAHVNQTSQRVFSNNTTLNAQLQCNDENNSTIFNTSHSLNHQVSSTSIVPSTNSLYPYSPSNSLIKLEPIPDACLLH